MYFTKVQVRGVCQGQNIVNILYYGDDVGQGSLTWNQAALLDLGDALSETLPDLWTAVLPLSYTLQDLVLTTVDERGITNSPIDITFPIGQAGVQGGSLTGVMLTAILAMETLPSPDAPLNLKRSYIAFGPMDETFVGNDQALTAGAITLLTPVAAFLEAPAQGATGEYKPVRIGRTVSPAPLRIGVVNDAQIRPYASTRRSRMKRPTGT